MFRVRTFNRIAQRGLNVFPRALFQVGPDIDQPHALLLRSHPLPVEDLQPGLLAIARAGAGINNIPVQECTTKGIVVFNTPGANANSVKELVLGALLLAARDVIGGVQFVESIPRELGTVAFKKYIEDGKKKYAGRELQGRTLGVVGLGAIGANVATIALSMGMKVLGYDPYLNAKTSQRVPIHVNKLNSLPALFAQSEFISIHVPATEENIGLIDRALLSQCEPGTVLLNFARSEIVNATDVLRALELGQISKYFNDFPLSEYYGNPKIFSTPHLGASTAEAEENSATMAVTQLVNFFLHGDIVNSVNFPSVQLTQTEGFRLAISTRRAKDTLSFLLPVLEHDGCSVIGLNGRQRGEISYHLFDLDQELNTDHLKKLRSLDQVIDVRAIGFTNRGS